MQPQQRKDLAISLLLTKITVQPVQIQTLLLTQVLKSQQLEIRSPNLFLVSNKYPLNTFLFLYK